MLPSQDDPLLKEKPTNPQRHWLRSGDLRCIYENGFIRYISCGNAELIRSVYPAVRDQSWQTCPVTISAETIEQWPDGFRITCQADYALDDIRYTAGISIISSSGKSLIVSFSGTAGSDFLRNRIGLCALLPPEGLRGRTCVIGHPGGLSSTRMFPQIIHPVQPFVNIASLEWETPGGVQVRMEFSGDIFETEDQRNWGDASYKIYSTPHDLPLPVQVRKGDSVRQEIRIRFENRGPVPGIAASYYSPVVFHTGNPSFPFPGIGYSYNPDGQTPDADALRMLRRLGIDHYRIEILLSGDWKRNWESGLETARRLGTKLLIAIYSAPDDGGTLRAFLAVAKKEPVMIAGLLLFSEREPLTTPALIKTFSSEIAANLPGVPVGSGSDTFFAHWNQQPVIPGEAGDFVAIPVSPQVHQTDSMTMVENLPAMTDIIETARFHSTAPVFMGPVTLKTRYSPETPDKAGKPVRFPYAIDDRQSSLFAAGWTAAALRYLCRADKITLFELTGDRGLLPAHSPEAGLASIRVFPVYLLLREIFAFKPKRILLSRSLRPTEVDGLVLENIHGDRLMVFINFTRIRQTLQLKTETWKTLPLFAKTISSGNVQDLQEDGEKFRSAPYGPLFLSEGNSCRVPAGAILFLTTLQDWSFS